MLLPVAIPALRTRGPDRRMLVRAGLTAGVILFGGYATQTVGLQYTSPSTSAFITGLYVVITPVIESVISRRLPRPPVVAGIVIATVGSVPADRCRRAARAGRGVHARVRGAVRVPHRVHRRVRATLLRPTQFTALQIGAVALLSVAPAAEQGVGSLSALAVFAVVFTGIACSALALPLQLWGQRRIPATRAALILLAEPVFAGLAGYVNGERLGAGRLVGGVAILVGIAVSELWPRASGATGRPIVTRCSRRRREREG